MTDETLIPHSFVPCPGLDVTHWYGCPDNPGPHPETPFDFHLCHEILPFGTRQATCGKSKRYHVVYEDKAADQNPAETSGSDIQRDETMELATALCARINAREHLADVYNVMLEATKKERKRRSLWVKQAGTAAAEALSLLKQVEELRVAKLKAFDDLVVARRERDAAESEIARLHDAIERLHAEVKA